MPLETLGLARIQRTKHPPGGIRMPHIWERITIGHRTAPDQPGSQRPQAVDAFTALSGNPEPLVDM